MTLILARFDYWRNVDSMRRGGNSKIQAPVLALVGEADPDRRNIPHSLMECSVDDHGNERNDTDACDKPEKDFISNE